MAIGTELMRMAQKITIEKLGEVLIERLLSISNLKAVYIGKTGNLQSAEMRHSPNYDGTIPVAVGTAEIVNTGEDYLIRLLKERLPKSVKVDNLKEGSAGNPMANMLYISLDIAYKRIEDLYDGDLFSEPFELEKS